PLIVPGPAWLRVGSETHHWQEGRMVIFDDTIEHEAKNEADETRIVLLFDVWRPELSEQERREVATLLGAIDSFSES
ncbi:MAG TPA: aspartyl beta-hydroxylase, partial [Hyphomonas sp.]|nr:aspartyl beta-hydroxylase [Hyphomonas sp.]